MDAMGAAREDEAGGDARPAWLDALSVEDLHFLRRFLLSSGSLKDLAAEYQVSYPTIRARLDRLIAKVKTAEDPKIDDPFVRALQLLVADGSMPHSMAKDLLAAHRESHKRRTEK
jgi:hypothetical protein